MKYFFFCLRQPWASTSPGGEVLHTLIYSDNPYQSPGKNWKKTVNVQPKRDRWHAPFIQWSIMDYINKWHAESIVTWHIYHSIKWGKKAKWELCKLNALNNNNERKHAWNNGCLQIVCRFRSSEKQKAKTGINRARNSLEKCPGGKLGGCRGRQGAPWGCDAGLTPTKGEGEGRGFSAFRGSFSQASPRECLRQSCLLVRSGTGIE